MIEVFCAVIASAATVICAFIAAHSKRREKHCDEQTAATESRARQRAEESSLLLAMVSANSQLTVGIAAALKSGHCNGEVEEGLKHVAEAGNAYQAFLEGIARQQLTKI